MATPDTSTANKDERDAHARQEQLFLVWREIYDDDGVFMGLDSSPQILFESAIRQCPQEIRNKFYVVPLTRLSDLPVG